MAVAKELKKLAKQEDVQPVEDDVDAHIAALVKDALSKQVGTTLGTKPWSPLHSILKQAHNKWRGLAMTISSLSSRGEGSPQLELVQWDSGKEDPSNIVTNDRIYAILADTMTAGCEMDEDDAIGGYHTELNSHANMPMLGRHWFILNDTGWTVEVNPFTPQYKVMTAKFVDGPLLYDCPYSGKSYVLVVQNAIHVPSMDNNLVLPFMMREAGIMVNEKAKIHMDYPKDSDHSIMFNSTGLEIPLYLWGIFSYFSTRCPM